MADCQKGAVGMNYKMSRRDFLERAVSLGVSAYGLEKLGFAPGRASADSSTNSSKVVVVTGPKLFVDAENNNHTPSRMGMVSVGEWERSIDQHVLNKMVNEGVRSFVGAPTPETAWRSLFKPNDVVGIKVNSFGGRPVAVRPETVAAVIAGLRIAGVKEENIIVWDRANHELAAAGFRLNIDGPGVKVKGTQPDGYEDEPFEIDSFKGRFSKILTREITALINLPCVKHSGGPKITCAMKNHYGSIDNPGDHHAPNGNCNPHLADLYRAPVIQEKTRLIIVDALTPLCDRGPGKPAEVDVLQWKAKTIMVGLDPVAIDHLGLLMIDEQRKKLGIPTQYNDASPKYLYTAIEKGVGTKDPDKLRVIRRIVI